MLAVDAVHLVVDEALEVLGGVLDLGRKELLRQQLDLLHLVGDGAGVGDDDLFGGVLAEVGKLLEHLLCRAEVDGAAPVGVGELLGGLKDLAVLLVLGVEKVHVRGGDDRLAELLAEPVDRAVVVLEDRGVADGAVVDQKGVVADGLDLEVVVERGDLFELLAARARHDRAVELAHAAGRADEDALAVLQEQAFGHGGHAVEVFEVGLADHLVQVFQARAVLDQQDHVVRLRHVGAPQRVVDGLDVVHGARALLAEHRQEFPHHARHDQRVVGGAVVVEGGQAEVVRDDVELEALELRAQGLAERERVEEDGAEADAAALRGGGHEAHVEVGVVGDDGPVADEGHEGPEGVLLLRRALHVGVPDAGERGDVGRDVALGVDEGVEGLEDPVAREADRADLGHAVRLRVEAGGLDVEGDELGVERQGAFADDGAVAVHVVDVVGLHAVDDLDAVLFARLPHVGEGLGHAVIGHGNGGHAPVGGALDGLLGVGQRVEGGKAGVQMQLHALLLRVVGADDALALDDVARVEHHVVVVFGVDDLALHRQVVAGLHRVDDGFVVLGAQKAGHAHGVGAVGEVEAQHGGPAFGDGAAGDGDDVALHAHPPGFERERVHRHGALLDGLAHQNAARRLFGTRRGGGLRRSRALPGIVRRDGHALQLVVGADAGGQSVELHGRGHGGKARRDAQRPLLHVHLHVGDEGLVQPARRGAQSLAAGKDCQKGCMFAHGIEPVLCQVSLSIRSISLSHSSS